MTLADSFQHGEFYRNDDPPEEHYDEDALEDGIENFRHLLEEVIGIEATLGTPDLDHIPRIQKALFKATTCGISFWHVEAFDEGGTIFSPEDGCLVAVGDWNPGGIGVAG